jgi:hypothetical protein
MQLAQGGDVCARREPPMQARPDRPCPALLSGPTEADTGTAAVFVDEESENLIGWPFTFSPPLAEERRRSIDHLLV